MIFALLILYLLFGFGLLAQVKLAMSFYQRFALSLITGMGMGSLVPFILTLVQVKISQNSILLVTLLLTFIPLALLHTRKRWKALLPGVRDFVLHIYEIPFFVLIGYYLFVSVWKCYYFPNIPFDTLVGSDLIAKATLWEGTLQNSIYQDFLPFSYPVSNQAYYAPFTMLMEVVFLYFGSLFGKVWLSILVIAFWLFFYFELRHYIHPLLAGMLILFAFINPEMYAYTFLVQTDYANAIFTFISVALLFRFVKSKEKEVLLLSALFFGFACWSRTETIFFFPLFGLVLLWQSNFKNAVLQTIPFLITRALFVSLWNYVFLGNYVPKAIPLGQFNFEMTAYFLRASEIIKAMNKIIGNSGYWAYSVVVPLVMLLANLLYMRNIDALRTLIWPFGLYLIFVLLVLHVVGANVAFTFRRGFFKIIWLMYLSLAFSGLLGKLSSLLEKKVPRPTNS